MRKGNNKLHCLFLFAGLLFCFNYLKALPATCGTATNVNEATSCVEHNYTLKKANGLSAMALPACASGANFDGWRKFTATATTTTITLDGSTNPGQDPAFAVYSGCAAADLVTCANATGAGGTETATFTTTIGTTYYIRVMDMKNGTKMAGQFCVYGVAPAPTNDDVCNAIAVTCGSNTNGTTVGATTDAGAPTCGGETPSSPGVWYQYTATTDTLVTASLCNAATNFDTQLYIYSGTCSSLTCVGFNDDDGSCTVGSGLQSTVSFGATAGVTYYILVSGFDGDAGSFELDISCSTSPCSSVPSLTENSSCVYTPYTANQTPVMADPSCVFEPEEETWYQFTATADYSKVTVTANQAADDPAFAIYTACGDAASEIACVENYFDNTTEVDSFPTTPGQTYYVRIMNMDASNMPGQICVVSTTPPPPSSADCHNGITICDDATFTGNSSGAGNVTDLNGSNEGCLTDGEQQSSWYYFQAQTAGTIGFKINPSNTDDYDFAVWGPFSTSNGICPPSGEPLRCSFAAPVSNYNTGLKSTAADTSEDALGNGFVKTINAQAGDIYILCITNYTADSNPFALSWQLTNGASLDCTPLAISINNFSGFADGSSNVLNWAASTTEINDNFEVQRSVDGINFSTIAKVNVKNNYSETQNYKYIDEDPLSGVNYYRLRLNNYGGAYKYSGVIAISRKYSRLHLIKVYPNPTTGRINISYYAINAMPLDLQIVNFQGNVIESKQIAPQQGFNTAHLSLNKDISEGGYFIKLINPKTGIAQHAFITKQ